MRKLLTCMGLVVFMGVALSSCDTPSSIAWSRYYLAKDTLEAGDPYFAKECLGKCNTEVDSVLAVRVDSLMKVIDKAIEEDR